MVHEFEPCMDPLPLSLPSLDLDQGPGNYSPWADPAYCLFIVPTNTLIHLTISYGCFYDTTAELIVETETV